MLDVKIEIKSIDYSAVADKALPIALEKLSQKENAGALPLILSRLKGLSTTAVKAALNVLPQDVKDDLAVQILSSYKGDIVKYINQMAADKNVKIEVGEISVEKTKY